MGTPLSRALPAIDGDISGVMLPKTFKFVHQNPRTPEFLSTIKTLLTISLFFENCCQRMKRAYRRAAMPPAPAGAISDFEPFMNSIDIKGFALDKTVRSREKVAGREMG